MNTIKKIIWGCFALGIIGLLWIGYEINLLCTKPMLLSVNRPVIVVIDKGSSASAFAALLKSKRLIQSSHVFLFLVRWQGAVHQLQAGVYRIEPGESAKHFLDRVIAGDVIIESFKIIEGSTLNQVMANLGKAAFLSYSPRSLEAIQDGHSSVEGLLLADTYFYRAGSDASQIVRLANQNLLQFLDYSWLNRDLALPYKSPYELLIAASIIEKEAFFPSEKKVIASVLVNRLRKNMPLQMDPTVIYALNSAYQGTLQHHDLSVDSPYNTYRYRGLPPTPIAMVGRDTIESAAHPLATNYFYFVAKGDGSHFFSTNYNEQKKAISIFKQSKGVN